MRIHITGCDWTWKTTLIEFLKEKTWMEVIKFSAPKTNNPWDEWLEYYDKNNKKFIWDNIILDRNGWIDEMIYWKIKWRKPLSLAQKKKFIRRTKNDLLIITYTDLKNIKEVFETRWEDFINLEEAKIINNFYKNKVHWLSKHLNNILVYDFKKDWKDLDKYFNNYIKQHLWKQNW